MNHCSLSRCLTLSCFFAILTQPIQAQLISPVKIDQFVTQVMDSANVPGLSLALIRNGKPVYSQGYGFVKSDSSQKVTPATVFDAASLSKPVFAFAVLQLVDEGKLDLDKPLYDYLPYPDAESDERYKLMTTRMVLSHRSGFPNWRGSQKLTLKNPPGQRFGYSGEGFVYLQKVVEKLTEKPLNDLMTERVFKPLQMTRSSYVWRPDFDGDYARPHNSLGFPEKKNKPSRANTAYSLQTTADDYSQFVLAILTGKGLKPQTWNQMLSPQTQLPRSFDGDTTHSTELFWGLGLGLEKTETGEFFWHWGDNGTFRCFAAARRKTAADPRSGDAAVVYFTNSFNGLAITETMLVHLLGGSHPAVAFLDYDSYLSPGNLFARNVLKMGVSEALKPFLNAENKSTIAEDQMNRTGNRLLNIGRTKEALEVFNYNLAAYPTSAAALYNYANGLLRNGNRAEAVNYYNQAIALKPDVGKARQILAGLVDAEKTGGSSKIILKGYPQARLVTLAGNFNEWDDMRTFFTRNGDEWVCPLDLKPGTYSYQLVVDGKWMIDPGNPAIQKGENGTTNSLLIVH